MTRQGYIRFNNQTNREYTSKQDIEFELCVIWQLYPKLKKNQQFETLNRQLVLSKRNNGLPKNILFIVYFVNSLTYFNAKIRYCFRVLHWNKKIFLYYNRYYRYLENEKRFGKRKILPKRNNYKLHFIPYIYHRQFTGLRMKNNRLY